MVEWMEGKIIALDRRTFIVYMPFEPVFAVLSYRKSWWVGPVLNRSIALNLSEVGADFVCG